MGKASIQLDGLGSLRRSHACGDVTAALRGQEVVLAGWVHRRRDHGGVIFIDLRDRDGIVQVVFKPEVASDAHERAGEVRSEYVILVKGVVEPRADDAINPKMKTGEVEVNVSEVRLLNRATPPPFPIEEESDVDEAVRLKHRIHDLRRPPLQNALRVRHQLYQSARSTLSERGFLEIETPMLARATPEGARDFLVPSRLQPGDFYALPQSPQIIKQLLMAAGYDRYFQIARCFRDEDQRSDRQLEFSQIDLEMSFVGVEDVLEILEEVTTRCTQETVGATLERPFNRITYAEAMSRYGIDRPDTRVLLELTELTDVFEGSEFKAFRGAVEAGGIVKALHIADADALSRSEIDRLESFVKKELGGKGLAWIRVKPDGEWQSPIVKFLSDEEKKQIAERTGAEAGSLMFFQADDFDRANMILARLRVDLGRKLGRTDDREWDALLVVDFPLFEKDEKGQLTHMHMPFVAPVEEDIPLLDSEPEKVRGSHYDVVVNGVELGSGSLRNHRADIQRRVLEIMGYNPEQQEHAFGFLLRTLDTGVPPHGGFAYGVDRWMMVLVGTENMREVVAFPKTQRGQDLLMEAPSSVTPDQLEELGIRVRAPRKTD